ncbi:MAG: dienelactone hydrolase family protein [Trueperaceae bacterium]|nr:dienelactone hydrolase family protein [Trueperaceae bacterium]
MDLNADTFAVDLVTPVRLPYLLHLPAGVEARRDWPLIVFLHGSGERGDDLESLRRHGLPRRIEDGLELPAVVLSPQCPDGQVWAQQYPAVMALVDDVMARVGIDPDRVFLTGLSLGGAGVVHLAATHPERFAALAPISGPWTFYYVTPGMARLPLWAFHGEDDPVVAVEDSRRLVAAVEALGGEARLTTYPGVAHDAWTNAYATDELFDWLLAQRRGG